MFIVHCSGSVSRYDNVQQNVTITVKGVTQCDEADTEDKNGEISASFWICQRNFLDLSNYFFQ